MKKADQWSGLFLFLLSSLIFWGSLDLPYGTIRDPGPGFLPRWLGVILGAMSLALILKSTLQREKARMIRELLIAKLRWKKIFLALAILFLFALLLDTLGFPVMVLLFLACLFRFIDPQPWKNVIGWALAGTVGFYLVFEYWLSLRFPKGPWGF
ncbi:MAG: tripartite tricarboxylate transporter TctB family protein [Deltaproteobacteria bacterium]|nr:tripartite tricarboxylate transporter TctB family protein [Deltaproteobacteria bacterium]